MFDNICIDFLHYLLDFQTSVMSEIFIDNILNAFCDLHF